ncbi:MAG: hypothetical protein Q4A71_07765 [Actinomycetaceae bacterium]|nr:hypothetical protein [Actinomycetaceae bacterium]
MEKLTVPPEAVFTYSLTPAADPDFACHDQLRGGLVLNRTVKTQALFADGVTTQVAVIGLCVDSEGELARTDIPNYLLRQALKDGPRAAYAASDRLAGKFLVYLWHEDAAYVWGDATHSLAIYYSTGRPVQAVGVTENLVASYTGAGASSDKAALAKTLPQGQPFPAFTTSFDDVKALLANHMLNLTTGKAHRQGLPTAALNQDLRTVVVNTGRGAANIYREYQKYYELVCPLTAGYDSRVNFALTAKMNPSGTCYTFKHPGFSDDTPDLRTAREICRDFALEHVTVEDQEMPEGERANYRALIGKDCTDYALDLAHTFRGRFGDAALLNGNAIDQVGKSLSGNHIPRLLLTPRFWRSRLYFRGPHALSVLRQYLGDIPPQQQRFVHDLVAWELDSGRWAAQSDVTYGMAGVSMLNLFNCRALIASWLTIPRQQRNRKILHRSLFRILEPKLLDYPFTPETTAKKIISRNWPLMYVATFAYEYMLRHKAR